LNRKLSLMALGVAVVLGGCSTSGNTGVPPAQQTADLSQNKLQFAVGTANIAGTPGLNTVVTYRQPNGQDGTLLNTPTITLPFTNTATAAQAGADAGTNRISGSPQPVVGTAASPSTFGSSGGAFAYGFQPDNSTTGGGVSFARYALPIYGAGTAPPFTTTTATAIPYIGGPPAYPNVRDATFPAGFVGYPMGFTDFRLTPVVGTYGLTLQVPTGFTPGGTPTSTTVSASGTLASTATLPTFPTPTFTPTLSGGAFTGGGTINVTVPAGVTEALITLQNRDGSCYPGSNGPPAYFTFLTKTPGAQVITVPANLGPTFGPQTITKTLCPGDRYRLYAVGFNYPAYESGPPNSTSPTPTIAGANGQADITTSAIGTGTSPAT
jgi:hypothetical protein